MDAIKAIGLALTLASLILFLILWVNEGGWDE